VIGSSVPCGERGEDLRDGVTEHGRYVRLVVGGEETAGGVDVFADLDVNMMEVSHHARVLRQHVG
jgi:hypothetical protein